MKDIHETFYLIVYRTLFKQKNFFTNDSWWKFPW